MKLYIVDHWVPFPQSEYGGIRVVVAKDDLDVINLIKSLDRYELKCIPNADNLIIESVKEAKIFVLDTKYRAYNSEIVSSFIT